MTDLVNLDNERDNLLNKINRIEPFIWENYQHAGDAVDLTLADTWYDLINDGEGVLTSSAFSEPGITPMWNTSTNRIDVSGLKVGDRVNVRVDVTPIIGTAVTETYLRFLLAPGVLDASIGLGGPMAYAATGTKPNVAILSSFTIFNETTLNNPIAIQARANKTGSSVEIAGWIISVDRV